MQHFIEPQGPYPSRKEVVDVVITAPVPGLEMQGDYGSVIRRADINIPPQVVLHLGHGAHNGRDLLLPQMRVRLAHVVLIRLKITHEHCPVVLQAVLSVFLSRFLSYFLHSIDPYKGRRRLAPPATDDDDPFPSYEL